MPSTTIRARVFDHGLWQFAPPIHRIRNRRLASASCSFLAAMLAMGISLELGLPRPWWVLMTVYVTTQPLAGALRPKMAYRLLGVALGASAAVTLVNTLVNTPALLSLALALWIGISLYFAVLDRTPRAYIFMLSGYTAAIVGFPYVDEPNNIFLTAMARVEEMSIAIICASLVHALLMPWNPAAVLSSRIANFLDDGTRWIADAFRGHHGFREARERRRFSADIAELAVLAIHLPFDTPNGGATRRAVIALQSRMSVLLPLASAVADRLDALRQAGPVDASLQALVEDVIAWLSNDAEISRDPSNALQQRCRRLLPTLTPDASWNTLLMASLGQRLSEFIRAHADCRELAVHIAGAPSSNPRRLARIMRRHAQRPLHRDRSLAALSGLAVAGALVAYCAAWILTAWPEGSATAAFAAIVSCSFAAQDDPAPAITKYLIFTLAALPVAAFYLFAVLPGIDGFIQLALVLAPVLIVMGYVQADPARSAFALPMFACFIVAMGFLERYTASFAGFFDVALAQIGGIIVTVGAARLFRSVGAAWSAQRLLREGWRETAMLAAGSRAHDEISWSHHMLDRLGMVAARLALLAPHEALHASDTLVDLRIGRNIIRLRRAAHAAHSTHVSALLESVLDQIGALYRARAQRATPLHAPLPLLGAIDASLIGLHAAPPSRTRDQGFLALTGMRRNLFPDAPHFMSEPKR